MAKEKRVHFNRPGDPSDAIYITSYSSYLERDEIEERLLAVRSLDVNLLYRAILYKNDKLIKKMVSSESAVLDINRLFDDDRTILHHAVIRGLRVDVIAPLLNAGASISVIDRYGLSPLHYALSLTCDSRLEVTTLLLERSISSEYLRMRFVEEESLLLTQVIHHLGFLSLEDLQTFVTRAYNQGFEVRLIPPQENSFFAAVVNSLQSLGRISLNSYDLRESSLGLIELESERIVLITGTIEEYLQNTRLGGYLDRSIIDATARILNVNIIIYHSMLDYEVINLDVFSNDVTLLLYEHSNHYVPILNIRDDISEVSRGESNAGEFEVEEEEDLDAISASVDSALAPVNNSLAGDASGVNHHVLGLSSSVSGFISALMGIDGLSI